ncbi:hypothetical protein EV201_0467 [Ancylomarina subtilis]|uniref:Uncharacterized protein n=1 Tax=Ancylomarina subtilis TaxID=1639035 RepID=A0A4Q7VIA6_9BACT|nr:hypothetical protein EV201_0467 [Ancylomarina subtilis]
MNTHINLAKKTDLFQMITTKKACHCDLINLKKQLYTYLLYTYNLTTLLNQIIPYSLY